MNLPEALALNWDVGGLDSAACMMLVRRAALPPAIARRKWAELSRFERDSLTDAARCVLEVAGVLSSDLSRAR